MSFSHLKRKMSFSSSSSSSSSSFTNTPGAFDHCFSKDILVLLATFLPSDKDVVRIAGCSNMIYTTNFLNSVPLRNWYSEKQCATFDGLNKRRHQIRLWHVAKKDNLNLLPPCIHKVEYSDGFDRSVENLILPLSLTELTFGFSFNQSVDNLILPLSLTKLTFGYRFNQSVDKLVLPSGLQELIFGADFN
jgi:hypothetical protein